MRALIISLAILSSSSFASAGLLIEPYLGYSTGTLELKNTTTDEYEGTGGGFGGRLGFTTMLFWGALDYLKTTSKADYDSFEYDFDHSQLGVTGGFDLPFGLRLFAGYLFDSQLKMSSDGPETTLKGSAVKVGAGYRLPLLPIAFNIEYIMNDFSKLKDADGEYPLSDYYAGDAYNTLFFSVSAPFSLL